MEKTIEDVLAAHTASLMALPGVVGAAIGLCDGVPCIRLLVTDARAAADPSLPVRLEGFRIRVEVSGPIRPR